MLLFWHLTAPAVKPGLSENPGLWFATCYKLTDLGPGDQTSLASGVKTRLCKGTSNAPCAPRRHSAWMLQSDMLQAMAHDVYPHPMFILESRPAKFGESACMPRLFISHRWLGLTCARLGALHGAVARECKLPSPPDCAGGQQEARDGSR